MAYTCFQAPTSDLNAVMKIVTGLRETLFPDAIAKVDNHTPGTIVVETRGSISQDVRQAAYQAGCAPRNP